MVELLKEIKQLSGLSLTEQGGRCKVTFLPNITLKDINILTSLLRKAQSKISIYDALYPSPSAPGAYVTYRAIEEEPNTWCMSLGNHGWTDGIYQIDDQTVAIQIFSLFRKGKLDHLSFTTGTLFFNSEPQNDENNISMVQRLRALHEVG